MTGWASSLSKENSKNKFHDLSGRRLKGWNVRANTRKKRDLHFVRKTRPPLVQLRSIVCSSRSRCMCRAVDVLPDKSHDLRAGLAEFPHQSGEIAASLRSKAGTKTGLAPRTLPGRAVLPGDDFCGRPPQHFLRVGGCRPGPQRHWCVPHSPHDAGVHRCHHAIQTRLSRSRSKCCRTWKVGRDHQGRPRGSWSAVICRMDT